METAMKKEEESKNETLPQNGLSLTPPLVRDTITHFISAYKVTNIIYLKIILCRFHEVFCVSTKGIINYEN